MPDRPDDEIVIVAENDSMMRGLLRTVLDQPGRRLLLCADGAEAVDRASAAQATLVLLDFRMPRLDGIETCRLIRDLPGYGPVPVVMLTVFDNPNTRRKAIRAGVSAFLGKPFSRDQLLRVIGPLIATQRRVPELERY
jgi:CheY-like chemotaxis protein